jgi:hypothetical protein
MHEQECFARKVSRYPVAQMLSSESLALPMAGVDPALLSFL